MSSTLPSFHPSLPRRPRLNILQPFRNWLDRIQIHDQKTAHLICRLIPCTCPFEHDFTLFGHRFHIPPMCKLNPFYNEFVSLRLRALAYLSDDCGEDVTQYIC